MALVVRSGGGRSAGRALALLAAALLSACGTQDLESKLAELRARQDEGKAAATLEEFTELASLHPEHDEVNFRLGLAMLAAGRRSEALFPLHKAAAGESFAVPAGIVLASTLIQTGNHAEALRATERVLERDAENEAALLMRASAAIELHDGELALEAVDRLISKSPDDANYRLVRAGALAEVDRLDDAEAIYRELIELGDDGEVPLYIRACIALVQLQRQKRKDADAAIAQVRACIEQGPADEQVVAALVRSVDDLGKDDEVIEILEQAIERHPDARALHEDLVSRLVKADRVPEARELAEAKAQEVDDPASWHHAALMRRRTGDVEAALEAVEKAISLSPRPNEEARYFRAELLIELGRLDEGEALIDDLESQLYKDVLTARIAQERGDLRRALELYGTASIDWPQNWGVRVLAARTAFALGDMERAKSDLLEATRQAPKETDAALWLAHVYFAEGNFRDCLTFTARQLKERGAVDPGTHLLRAEAFAATNRMRRALATLDQLAKLREGEFRTTAWAAAARLRARSDPAEALAELEKQISEAKLDLADPANEQVMNQLFDLHLQTGRADAARARLDALLAEHPDSANLHGLRGRVALFQGHGDEAERHFVRALELAPDDGGALAGLALLQRQNGDLDAAIETMTRAAAAAPYSADYSYMAARMTLDSGDRAGARKQFEEVLRAHPGHVGSANDLAFLLAEDGTALESALRHAELAVRLRPSPETLDTLGYVKLRQGAAEEAVGLFERALARQPDYATARYHLALALIERGEPAAARQALEEALAHPFPEQQEARKVLARIDSGEARP